MRFTRGCILLPNAFRNWNADALFGGIGLAAVVRQFRIGTVLEPVRSADITPSTAFRGLLESYHLDS
jgi:hypothetical protein